MELHDLADSVETEEDFLNFLAALMHDKHDEETKRSNQAAPFAAGPNGWENGSISAFLDASVAWGRASMDGMTSYQKPVNPWRRAAHILHAGKFYE